jgi:iron(III) transport system permease protein
MVFDTGFMSSPDNAIAGIVAQGSGKNLHSPNQAARAAAAVATTLPLLGCTIFLAVLAIWGAGKTSAADSLTVGPWPKILNAPWWAAAITLLLIALNIGLPVWALVQSLHVKFSISRMWDEFGPLVQGAILVACMATVICMLSSFSSAARWTPGMMAIGGASFLIGGQLLAIALIRIYNRELFAGFTDWIGRLAGHMMSPDHAKDVTAAVKAPFTLSDWAYDAFPVPVMAYVGRFGWLALAGARGTWSRSWKDLRDMAAVDGAGVFRTAFSVVWPLSWPTLVAGAMLVGALSLTEVPATVLLFPAHPQVLTPTLMTWVHMARFDPMIEASLLMMMAVLAPALAAVLLTGIGLKMSALRDRVRR